MRVVGIDPGFDRVGWAVLEGSKLHMSLISCGLIKTNKVDEPEKRLQDIYGQLSRIIKQHRPNQMAVESIFFFKNAKTIIGVSQARGVILLTGQLHRLSIIEFTPLQVKSIVAGSGTADKKAVEKMVRLQVTGVPDKLVDDTIDAIAIGMACVYSG